MTDLQGVWGVGRRWVGLIGLVAATAAVTAMAATLAHRPEPRASVTLLIGEEPVWPGGGNRLAEPTVVLERALLSQPALEQVAIRAGFSDGPDGVRERIRIRSNPGNGIVDVTLRADTTGQALAAAQAVADYVVARHAALQKPLATTMQQQVNRLAELDRTHAATAERIRGRLERQSASGAPDDPFRYQIHVLAENQVGQARSGLQEPLRMAELALTAIRPTTVLVHPTLKFKSLRSVIGVRMSLAGLSGGCAGFLLAAWLDRRRGSRGG